MREPIRGGDPLPRAESPGARVRAAREGAEPSARASRPEIRPLSPADLWPAWTDEVRWAVDPKGVARG